jgi:predicted TIM-barrel fold metal-dependent hydrolase
MPLYEGPIVDSHHHTIWDCEANYPWMHAPMRPMIFGDDWSGMKQNYSIEQFIADSASHNVTQSVHVQANFDMTRPADETKGLQGFADQHGFPHGIVAYADLTDSNVEKVLASHLEYANTRGIRQQVYWHNENEYWRFVDRPDFCRSNAFRRGLSALAEHDLTFDWQGFDTQFDALAELAKAHSGVRFCLVHAGMLTGLDTSTVNGWTEALEQLVPRDNVFIKVSGLNTFSRSLDEPLMTHVTDTVLDKFGVDRCFFGSNFPVERMWTTFADYTAAQKRAMAGRSDTENGKFFHDTAKAFYRI